MLDHLRVIELGQVIAGTLGGMILADLGADVIKVEPPQGDAGRRRAVYGIGEESAIHLSFNRSKRSIAVDLKTPEGRRLLLDLVRTSDVVIENFRPGVMARLGIDYEALREVNPLVVLVSVSGFGGSGPGSQRPAYDLIMQAATGHMSIMGEQGRPPVIFGVPLADMQAGVFSAIAALAGVMGRDRSGTGTHVDLSMFDVMLSMLGHVGTLFLNTGIEQVPQGSSHPFITPWQAFECQDGAYIVVAPREERFWRALVDALDLPALRDPDYATAEDRTLHRDVLLRILSDAFLTRPSAEWLAHLESFDVPVAPVRNLAQAFADPVVSARAMVTHVERAGGGDLRLLGNPLKFVDLELPRPVAAPALGGNFEEVLRGVLGYSAEEIEKLLSLGVISVGPVRPPDGTPVEG